MGLKLCFNPSNTNSYETAFEAHSTWFLKEQEYRKKWHTTFSNGCLGSHNDEERSEMRYVIRIAKPRESSKLWTHIALPETFWEHTYLSVREPHSTVTTAILTKTANHLLDYVAAAALASCLSLSCNEICNKLYMQWLILGLITAHNLSLWSDALCYLRKASSVNELF